MKNIVLLSFLPILIMSFNSCNSATSEVENTDAEEIDLTVETASGINGFQILESNCFSCHNPDANSEPTAAPNMAVIKSVYLEKYPQQNEFREAMIEFTANPSEDKSIVEGAVETYGVMPKLGYSEEQISAMADYIYSSTIENENWFTKEYPLEKAKNIVDPNSMSFVDRGFQFAMSTKAVLGKSLKGKIKSEGTVGALTFCNLRAIPLVDSMSVELNASIHRVSDKPRNPNNEANADELGIIKSFKEALERGEDLKPTTVEMDDMVIGYYPIVTNEMCLQCHGGQNDIKSDALSRILELYPNDKAQGYGVNQLRGLFVVEMKR